MQDKHDSGVAILCRRITITFAAASCLFVSGCATQQLSKHATALSTATAPVVTGAAAAYQAANEIHEKKTDYDAIPDFDKTEPVYNPRVLHPLLTYDDIELRLKVLTAFQLYVAQVVDITKGTSSPELDAASTSFGTGLANLGNTVLPAPATSTTATSATPDLAISTGTQNAISTGVNALGQFLVNRVIQKDLPQKVKDMDPQVDTLCKLMIKEVDELRDIETKDFNSIIDRRTLFIRDPANKLSPAERQHEILELPELGREQHKAEEQLIALRKAIFTLDLTHHALAAEAQGNNPESLKNKIGDLEAAGKNLGKYYSSLPE